MRRLVARLEFCLAVCLIFFLAAVPANAAPSLVGTWFGQGQPGDQQSMYLDRLTAGGQIHSRFRDCPDGKPKDSHEEGTWSLSGSTLIIQINFHNGMLM